MAGLKEIKRRLKSVKNTKKITYAMKLVSAAKLRKAQDAVAKARDYSDVLYSLIGDLARACAGSDTSHPLMEARSEVKTVGLVIVGGSRGLCGAYNTNVNKATQKFIDQKTAEEIEVKCFVLGRKPAEYCRKKSIACVETYEELPESANDWPIDTICRAVEKLFIDGDVDQVHVISTQFKSAISMTVQTRKLLPLEASSIGMTADEQEEVGEDGVTLFEPSAEAVFDAVVPRIISSVVRQACLDAKASEHGSRMTSMDSATKNADELGQKLQLTHNKLRQSGITSELLDIIGGSEGVN